MLRLNGPQAESLWDEVLPIEVRELPEDLARLDRLLGDPALVGPVADHWRERDSRSGGRATTIGRPTIPIATYVRLMVVKQRSGWGYETLVKEVSDSLHLRRFCLIALDARVPDESTVRKLTRRLGPEVVAELTRELLAKAVRERRFSARAARIDSTVVEADIRYPSDAMLALQGAKALAREGRGLGERIGGSRTAVRDRSRAIGRRVRQISRTIGRRSGEAREQVIELNRQAGELLRRSARQAQRLARAARSKARALDGGFGHLKSEEQLAAIGPERVFVAGRREPVSSRTKRRLRRYRTGAEGRISHLKRGYGLKRSRLKGAEGQRIWTGWGILAYNLDTLAVWEG